VTEQQELRRFEFGAEVWVYWSGKWRRGNVAGLDTVRVQVAFWVNADSGTRLRWFGPNRGHEVLPGSYSAPQQFYCEPCGSRMWGDPGQSVEQVKLRHTSDNPHHAAAAAQPRHLWPLARLLDVVASPDTLVWVAVGRKLVDAHRYIPGAESTPCGRGQSRGTTATAQDAAAAWGSRPCRRCWPAGGAS